MATLFGLPGLRPEEVHPAAGAFALAAGLGAHAAVALRRHLAGVVAGTLDLPGLAAGLRSCRGVDAFYLDADGEADRDSVLVAAYPWPGRDLVVARGLKGVDLLYQADADDGRADRLAAFVRARLGVTRVVLADFD